MSANACVFMRGTVTVISYTVLINFVQTRFRTYDKDGNKWQQDQVINTIYTTSVVYMCHGDGTPATGSRLEAIIM